MLLTHGAYDAMGGLAGAVAERAERSIAQFLPGGEPALRRLFLMLVRPGQGTPDTRRRVAFADADELTEQMVAVLADARLLVVGSDPVNGARTVEIAHEALIQTWHRLRDWVTADREFLVWRQRLGASLEGWQRSNDDPDLLARGAPLIEAEDWLEHRGGDLSDAERSYVQASMQARLDAEAATRRARRRVVLQLTSGLVFFAVLAAIASGIALQQARAANRERNAAIDAFGDAETSRAAARTAQADEESAEAMSAVLADRLGEAGTDLQAARRRLDEANEAAANGPRLVAAAEEEVARAEANLVSARAAAAQASADADAARAGLAAAERARTDAERQRDDARATQQQAEVDRDAAEESARHADDRFQDLKAEIDALCPGRASLADLIIRFYFVSFDPAKLRVALDQALTENAGCL
jgi:hypothetical protein